MNREEAPVVRTIELAGIPFCYRFFFPQTETYIDKKYYRDEAAICPPVYEVTREYLRDHVGMVTKGSTVEYLEYCSLLLFFGDLLLKYRRCAFHGAAVLYRGKVWIFAGPSGRGKTTQYLLWKKQFPDIGIVNGDKPILSFDGTEILVHPSPWNGKENFHDADAAPLGGIIWLEQGDENQMGRLSRADAVAPVFRSVIFSADTAEEIDYVSGMTEQIIETVPVWRFVNRGDAESVRTAHDTISAFMDQREGGQRCYYEL